MVWHNFLSLFLKALDRSLHHKYKHVETNRRVTEHNSYPLEYQSLVETPVHQTGQTCCTSKLKKKLIFEWSHPVYIYYQLLNGFLTRQYLSLPIARYWYLCSPFSFEKQRWLNSLILDFSSVCVMVVYKVEKWNALMLLQTYWDLELKVSNRFSFF